MASSTTRLGSVSNSIGKSDMDMDATSLVPPAQTEDSSKSSEAMSSTYDIVVELLNDAAVMQKGSDKIVNLRKVQELIVNKSPDLLDNFMDEMLAFQSDVSKDVKKFIIAFMEDACKKDHECLSKVLPSMIMLLSDDDVGVQKKVVLTVSSIIKVALSWISKAKKTCPEMTEVWFHLEELKDQLLDMLESVNDGIRTHVVKFLEGLTLILSHRTPESEIPKNQEKEFSLEQMPETNGVVDVNKLEEEGNKAFMSLLQFQGSPHISSINLMTVMNALSTIGKQRPQFFDQIVQSFEALHVNLPPTLAKSQVSSVRKNLKNQLLSLLKHPSSIDLAHQVTTLLTDLGASQSEISKSMPREADVRKRKAPSEPSGSGSSYSAKKTKIEIDDEDEGMTPWVDRSKKSKPEPAQKQTAIDVTAEDILPRLNIQNVSDLVLLSMVMLPEAMPAQFQSTYTPIAAAGTESQISHIARLLATQLTMAGMGKGLGELQMQAKMKESASEKLDNDEQPSSPKQIIQTVVGLKTDEPEMKKPKIHHLPPAARKIKQFQLSSVTKPIKKKDMETLLSSTLSRLIGAEKTAVSSHTEHHRMKILACLTAQSGELFQTDLIKYIFQDIRAHQDLAFAWLYQEYALCHGYSANNAGGSSSLKYGRYDKCLEHLFNGLMEISDHHADIFFHRLIQEAPVLTDVTLAHICQYCLKAGCTNSGMRLLTQLINNRPAHRLKFLNLMLSFSTNENAEVRIESINAAKSLHVDGLMQSAIEKYASSQLKKLLLPEPPSPLKILGSKVTWTEDCIKAQLYLHLELLPANHKLIHELANIYTATTADIKRTILRVLEVPVRGMGMDSPELLTLVENCPKGSETLVMRVIHILTDKAVPSPELVERIRDLYHKRVPDVRFLIPVLNGLSKIEVIEALPKLIKLNPHVVKEVFNRLMGSHITSDSVYHSPLTPVELLVALHNIEPSKCDMKTVIKAANMCFSERNVYDQETVAIVMQKLMEIDPLPTLLMRTVIQSMSMYPRLIGFVLNILQRLIVKKVWKQKKVWEGFIRCCQRAKPQSFQVLLTLPAVHLREVFDLCPDLRQPLVEHVQSFTDHQRAHVNPYVLAYLQENDASKAAFDQKTDDSDKHKSNGNPDSQNESPDVLGENIQKIGSLSDSNVQKIGSLSDSNVQKIGSLSDSNVQKIGSLSDSNVQKIGSLSDSNIQKIGSLSDSNVQKIGSLSDPNVQKIGSLSDPSMPKIATVSSVIKPLTSSSRSPSVEDNKEKVNSPVSDYDNGKEKVKLSGEKEDSDIGKSAEKEKKSSKNSKKEKRDSHEDEDVEPKSKSSRRSSTMSKSSSQSRRSSSSKKK